MAPTNPANLEWSLFMRTVNNLYTIMERRYLTDEPLPLDKIEKLDLGIHKFQSALILISQNNRLKGGKGMKVPFAYHRMVEV